MLLSILVIFGKNKYYTTTIYRNKMAYNQQEGLRYNAGKLRYDLLHPKATEGLVKILSFGASKYEPRNWELGMKWSKVIPSLKRHIAAIEKGEDYDPESGFLHIDHVQCNAHFLSAYYSIYPQGDDRAIKALIPRKIGLDIDGVLADFTRHLLGHLGCLNHIPTHWNDPIIRNGFEKIKKDISFWETIPVLTPPKDIPFEPHCYITSRSIEANVTQNWLDLNRFPKAPLICVGHDESKIDAAKKSGIEIFVDDRYENFVELTNAGIFTYLFDQSYNRHYEVGHRRLKSLKEL